MLYVWLSEPLPAEPLFSLMRFDKGWGHSVPAAALTAFARSEDRRRLLLAGYQMHVPKPIEASELVAIVSSLAGRVPNNGSSTMPDQHHRD